MERFDFIERNIFGEEANLVILSIAGGQFWIETVGYSIGSRRGEEILY